MRIEGGVPSAWKIGVEVGALGHLKWRAGGEGREQQEAELYAVK